MLVNTAWKFNEVPHDKRPFRNPPKDHDVEMPNFWGVFAIYLFDLFIYNSFAVMETITTPLVTDVD